jgi:hypothetical protein
MGWLKSDDHDAKIIHIQKTHEGSESSPAGNLFDGAVSLLSLGLFDSSDPDEYRVTLDDGREGRGATPADAAADAKRK